MISIESPNISAWLSVHRSPIWSLDSSPSERRLVWTSLRYKVLCRFTAYVAVDRTAVIEGTGQPHRIVQPVELPAGWNPEAGGIARRQASSDAWAARLARCPNPAASRHIRSNSDEPHRSEKRCKTLPNRQLEPNPRMAPEPPPKR